MRIGLDPLRYATTGTAEAQEKEFFTFDSQISDTDRFRDADPLNLICPSCSEEAAFVGLPSDASVVVRLSENVMICSSRSMRH